MRIVLFLACTLILVAPGLRAQQPARGSGDAMLGITSLAGNAVSTAGARLWLHPSERWSLGAQGTFALHEPGGGDLEGSGLRAEFGSGGVVVALRPGWVADSELRLTGGVGSVSLTDGVTDTTVDTEAFWIVEPAVAWSPVARGSASFGAEAGYRIVFGADELTRLDSSDLGGPTFSLFLRLSSF